MTTSRPNESELSAEVTAVHEANPVRMNWGGVVSPAAHLTLYLYCDTTTLPGTMVHGTFRGTFLNGISHHPLNRQPTTESEQTNNPIDTFH